MILHFWFLIPFQMPTFILFKDGNKLGEVVGASPPKLQVSLLS